MQKKHKNTKKIEQADDYAKVIPAGSDMLGHARTLIYFCGLLF
jgi:hypothetical protein